MKLRQKLPLLLTRRALTISMDFVNDRYAGGTLPDASNNDDGRLLHQFIVSTQPNYLEQADGSLKQYAVTSAIRRSNLMGLVCGFELTNVDLQGRTMNNASWTLVGCTVAKNQAGRTQVANSMCRVTLTAATATLTMAIPSSDATTQNRIAAVEGRQSTGSGGALALSVDNGGTFPTLTVKAIPGANSKGLNKYRFAAAQTIASPQKQIKLTGTIGDTWDLDFSETLDSGSTVPGDVLFEMPPIATTTGSVKVWRDRATSPTAGYSGMTIASPAALFLRNQANQAHYFKWWQRRDGGILVSDGGIQIQSDQTIGFNGFGMQTFTGGIGKKPIYTTDLYAPIANKAIIAMSATESFMILNDGALITGPGGSQVNALTHCDWDTNGAALLRNLGGMLEHTMTTDVASMKALALAGFTAS